MLEEISTEKLAVMLSKMSAEQRQQLQHLVGQLLFCCGSDPENMCVAVVANPAKGTLMIHALNLEETDTIELLSDALEVSMSMVANAPSPVGTLQ